MLPILPYIRLTYGFPTPQRDPVPKPQGDPTGVAVGDGYPASQLDSGADLRGDRVSILTGRASPVSQLHPVLEPS